MKIYICVKIYDNDSIIHMNEMHVEYETIKYKWAQWSDFIIVLEHLHLTKGMIM